MEYNLPYLQSSVKDIGLPVPFKNLIPLVEYAFSTPENRGGGGTTGTINPGLLWETKYLQIGAEAVIPANAATGSGVAPCSDSSSTWMTCCRGGLGIRFLGETDMRAILCLVTGWLLLAGAVARAEAHAFLDHAQPAVGSRLDQPPREVRLWFTEPVEPAFSSFHVEDAKGRQVNREKPRGDAKNRALLEVHLPPLPRGTYRVLWHVVATDAHRTDGHFEFSVK